MMNKLLFKTAILAVSLAMAAVGLTASGPLSGQEQAEKAAKKAPRGRLPNYYAKVVTPEQREKIYAIQQQYAPKIAALQKQLQELLAQRAKEIEAVLTPEQLKQVQEAAAAAKKRPKTEAAPSDGETKE